jgi:hypothetical protein
VHNKKIHHGGSFDNEEQAAMSVNLLCDKLEMERKNPTININDTTFQPAQNKTSKFYGVSWHTDSKKWQVQLMNNKNLYYGGLFDNEEQAAMKLNLLCDEYGIERKNPTININPNAIQQKNQTSKFTGVSWDKERKKWHVQLIHNKKRNTGGYFDNEEHAAMKVNLLCDEYEIKRKNPGINIKLNAIQQKTQTSKFTGVWWNNDTKKWRANLLLKDNCKKKNYYGGVFDNEEQAAMTVNLLCDKYRIERKNPTIDINPNAIIQQKNQTSKFHGVCWHKDNKKWQAQFVHNKTTHYGRTFDNEEQAAMSVNLLCDKLEMKRKNPSINTKPNAIQQKTKSNMYQLHPEKIVNENIKVKDENILNEFKDECENRFMASNEDASPQNHANAKRKRKPKQNLIVNNDVMEEKLKIHYS